MTHSQGLLCENPQVHFEIVWMLNPTTYLPTEVGTLDHNCEEVIDEIFSSRPDLMDTLLQNPVLKLFTDGRSLVQDRQCKAGYAIIVLPDVWIPEREERRLPKQCNSQKREVYYWLESGLLPPTQWYGVREPWAEVVTQIYKVCISG